jgi:diguanylate cyclase (GGDEF)-like protein/PAS domain S-box-containing protein
VTHVQREAGGGVAASDRHFRRAFHEAPNGMTLLALDGRFLHVNRQLCEMLGYSEEELYERSFTDVTHPEDRGPDLESVERAIAGEFRVFRLEKRYLRKDGEVIWIRLSVALVRDDAGSPLYLISQTEDITREKTVRLELAAAEEELRLYATIVEQSEDAIVVRGQDGGIAHWNAGAERLYGYTSEEAIGQPASFLIPPDREGEEAELLARALRGESMRQLHTSRVCQDGHVVHVSLTMSPIRGPDGVILGVVGIARDITAEATAQDRLLNNERQLYDAQALAHVGSWEWDLREERPICSAELSRILGFRPGHRPTAAEFIAVAHPDDRQAVRHHLIAARGGRAGDFEYRIVRRDGEVRYVHGRQHTRVDEAGRPSHIYGIVQDITERRRYESELERLATHDALTGLPNRRTFDARLAGELQRARRHRRNLCLAILDLDHFKQVNDTFGHQAGDSVLTLAASVMSSHVRGEELIARVGGEEFAWILSEADAPGAVAAVERCRGAVAAANFGEIGAVTLSGGVALASVDIDAETLFRRADEALYAAKRGGRNRVMVHDW